MKKSSNDQLDYYYNVKLDENRLFLIVELYLFWIEIP